MIVKDFLMKFEDINRLHDRYLELYPLFADYELDAMSPEELNKCYMKFFDIFQVFIYKLREYKVSDEHKDKVIFVCKQAGMFFDDANSTCLNSWFSYKSEIYKNAGETFSLWNSDDDNRIEHYAYDMSPIEEILSMEVWVHDVDEIDAACEIINEMTFFGFDNDRRENKIKEIHESLEQSMKEIESGEAKTIPAEQVFAELEAEILAEASEEERIKILADRKEKEKNKERDHEYMCVASHLNHVKCVEAILSYYKYQIECGNITF